MCAYAFIVSRRKIYKNQLIQDIICLLYTSENVMFGPLRVRGANKEEAEKLARELLAKVGLAEMCIRDRVNAALYVVRYGQQQTAAR